MEPSETTYCKTMNSGTPAAVDSNSDAIPLPPSTHVGRVRLAVSNLAKSVSWYTYAIGLKLLDSSRDKLAVLGAHGSNLPLLELEEVPGVRPLGRQTRLGMYHFAVLLPSRKDLANFIQHLAKDRIEFGAADHLFSEATYLVDPDGLSVEVYADRPREQWIRNGDELVGAIDPLNYDELLAEGDGKWNGAPSGTTIGHMHFYVGDLALASAFYVDGLGFEVMTRMPGALFVSAGGYHHHAGLNTWAARSPVAGEQDARLLSWELVLPNQASVDGLTSRLVEQGYPAIEKSAFRDTWGNLVRLVVES